ncbi:MAG: hypothetical protein ACYC5H_10710 [Methylovirgula sp.]
MKSPSLSYRRGFIIAPLALALLLTIARAADAQPSQPPYAAPDRGAAIQRPCHSLSGCDRRDYDYSGTRGRMGLGADPAHPEGPGNAPN